MPVALDAAQAWLDGQQRTCHPALLLVTAPPAIDPLSVRPNLRQERLQAVGSLQADAEGPKQAQPVQGEGLLHAFVQAANGRLVDQRQLPADPQQGRLRLSIGRPLVGGLELPAPGRLLGLREVPDDLLPLVPLAALHQRLAAEHGLDRLAQPLGAVEDHEEALLGAQPPLDQLPEEGGAHRLILGRGLHESQDDLLPGEGDPQRDDHRILRKRLAIEQQGDEVVALQPPLAKLPQLLGARPDEPTGDGGRAQAERGGDRLGARLIPATGQAMQDLAKEPGISSSGLLELLVRGERDLGVLEPVAHPLVDDGELLIQQIHRPALPAPADGPRTAPRAAVPLSGQGDDLIPQGLLNGLQPDGDEGLDERHLPVHTLRCRHRDQPAEPDIFHLALSLDSEYPLHGAAPFCGGLWGFFTKPLHHTGAASSILN